MKKIVALLLLVVIVSINLYSCSENATVEDAIFDIGFTDGKNESLKYDLDERFTYFQTFSANGEGWIHLNREEGITAMIFYTEENDDGSVKCILKEIYVVNYGSIGKGWLHTEETIKNVVGDDIEFTLFLENNVVTTNDLPTLLPLK